MAEPEPREPVVVEAVVNREKLHELLALEAEYSMLDFKEQCDLAEKRDQVELAKDVGAMSVAGGFIVVGVDGRGKPTGMLTKQQTNLFDEARLKPKLQIWLPDSLGLHSQVHEEAGKTVALVHVAPNPAGCAFFRANGQYQDSKKGLVTVFKEGDVFFRDGTQSRRLNQRGLERVIERRLAAERKRWDEEHAAEYQRLAEELRSGTAGQQVALGPAAEFSLSLEPEVLSAAAVELVRVNDDVPASATAQARRARGACPLRGPERGATRSTMTVASRSFAGTSLRRRRFAGSSVINSAQGFTVQVRDLAEAGEIESRLSKKDAQLGFAGLVRQCEAPDENARFDLVYPILKEACEAAADRGREVRLVQLESWARARKRLRARSLTQLMRDKLVNERGYVELNYQEEHSPQYLLSAFNYGDLLHWGEKRDVVAAWEADEIVGLEQRARHHLHRVRGGEPIRGQRMAWL